MPNTYCFTVYFFCLFLFCCTEEKQQYSIADEQFIDILVDVHLAEAALQNYYGDEKDSLTEVLYENLFELNNIDSFEFRTNLKKLKRDPKKLQAIYTLVVEELSVKESGSVSKKEPKKK